MKTKLVLMAVSSLVLIGAVALKMMPRSIAATPTQSEQVAQQINARQQRKVGKQIIARQYVDAKKVHWIPPISELPRAAESPLLSTPLAPGDLAPDFSLPDQSGKLHRLSQLRGKTVVLSFYPQDFTQSCTTSATSLSYDQPLILARGAIVFAVSVQSVASKSRFARDYQIKIPLLADTEKDVARRYHVLSEDGRAGRVTFIIGPDGHIESTDQNVHTATHGADVLAQLDRYQ